MPPAHPVRDVKLTCIHTVCSGYMPRISGPNIRCTVLASEQAGGLEQHLEAAAAMSNCVSKLTLHNATPLPVSHMYGGFEEHP